MAKSNKNKKKASLVNSNKKVNNDKFVPKNVKGKGNVRKSQAK